MYNPELLIELNKSIGKDGSLLKKNELESCFSSVDYYDSEFEKVCSIARSVILNHPFKDGNKRTAIWLVLTHLSNELEINESDYKSIVNFVIDAVIKHYTVQQWVNFFNTLKGK